MIRLPSPVRRVSWITDVHLETARKLEVDAFITAIQRQNPDVVLLCGDTDLAKANEAFRSLGVGERIKSLQKAVECPLLFVCGNHDYYFGSIKEVQKQVKELSLEKDGALYLHEAGIVELNEKTAVIGYDGWADGRAGNLLHSHAVLNDFFLYRRVESHASKRDFYRSDATEIGSIGRSFC